METMSESCYYCGRDASGDQYKIVCERCWKYSTETELQNVTTERDGFKSACEDLVMQRNAARKVYQEVREYAERAAMKHGRDYPCNESYLDGVAECGKGIIAIFERYGV
jgi:hypothetical protein